MNLLSKEYGSYYPSLFNKKILNEFNNLILTCDHCLYLCYKIEKISKSKKIPIESQVLIPTILQAQFLNFIVLKEDINLIYILLKLSKVMKD